MQNKEQISRCLVLISDFMSDLAEVNRILGLPTVPYETLDSMKTLAGKLT